MGHREKLLAGAKRCIYERGYARTTARDIVQASGTNLASIGYHFGTKEALLDAAMMEALGEWGAELERAVAAEIDTCADPMARFGSVWGRVIGSFEAHRPALVASFEALVRAERSPELREKIVAGHEEARSWLASLFGRAADAEGFGREVGSFYLALLNGLMVQWMLDPERAPTGSDVADALREVLEGARLVEQPPPTSG